MWWRVAADVFIIALFVVIGRDTHDESNAVIDVVETMAPFVIATAASRVLAPVRNAPDRASTGFLVAACTVVGGLALRRVVFSGGTAASFIAVAALFLASGMLTWRLLWRRLGPSPDVATGPRRRSL